MQNMQKGRACVVNDAIIMRHRRDLFVGKTITNSEFWGFYAGYVSDPGNFGPSRGSGDRSGAAFTPGLGRAVKATAAKGMGRLRRELVWRGTGGGVFDEAVGRGCYAGLSGSLNHF